MQDVSCSKNKWLQNEAIWRRLLVLFNSFIAGSHSEFQGVDFENVKGAQAWDIRDRVIHTERSHLDRWLEDLTKKSICVQC